MNVVLAEEAAEIAGVEPGYRGDRLVTDAWAQELGLRERYEWRRLDEVMRLFKTFPI